MEIDILNYILCPLETFPSFSELIQTLKTSCPVRDVDLCLELKKVKLKVEVHCTKQQDGRHTLETQNGAKTNKKRKRKSEEEIEKNGAKKRIREVKESSTKAF